MTCHSKDLKILKEQKPNIVAGIGFLSDVIMNSDSDNNGMLFIYYEPNVIDGGVTTRVNVAAKDEVRLSAVIAMIMAEDECLRRIITLAVETLKED